MLRKFVWPSREGDLSVTAQRSLALLLATITIALIVIDAVWIYARGFNVDVHSYAVIALLLMPLVCGASVYSLFRPDPLIGPTCTASAFLLAFSPSCALLSYLLSTVAGTRIDDFLAQIDQAIGFHWVAVMMFAADHKILTALLGLAYVSAMPQIMLLATALGWTGRTKALYGLCLSIAAGALLCVLFWTWHPSFGAFAVFNLPHATAAKLGLALDGDYGRYLVALLKNGPGLLTPLELRGIVGFPSFHTVQAIVLIWYARKLPVIRWISFVLNILMLVSTPIQGGHHLVDLFGGAVVAVAAILLSDWTVRAVSQSRGVAILRANNAAPAGAAGR